MKVWELIDKLNELPRNANIMIPNDRQVEEIHLVIVSKDIVDLYIYPLHRSKNVVTH